MASTDAKRCLDCGEFKPLTEFWRRKQSADGLAPYCRECFGLRNAASNRGRQRVEGKTVRPYRRHSAVPEGMKYCAHCRETLPISEFGRNSANKSGLAYYCRPCHNAVMADNKARNHGSVRSYLLKRRYGMSEDEVIALAGQQDKRCQICLRRKILHVDHDHSSNEFRGLLCFNCNNGLGQFEDDLERMRQAADYLLETRRVRFRARRSAVHMNGQSRGRGAERAMRRHYRLTARYGIGADEVAERAVAQGGLCLACRDAPARDVDHDHKTGRVRGILCSGCNTGMGQFRDDPVTLRRGAAYLEGTLVRPYRMVSGALWVTEGRSQPGPQTSLPEETLAVGT